MKFLPDPSTIYSRYDIRMEMAHGRTRTISDDAVFQEVADLLVAGDNEGLEAAVGRALDARSPMDIINQGLIPGMSEVSRLWEEGHYFLPQVILSSDAMLTSIALCELRMGRTLERRAKVVTHTAEGDIHDIGQVIVNALLKAAGFEVIDLGADVPVDTVVDCCKVHKPIMLTGTALMTTTMTAFARIAGKLKQAGLSIPFVCGGGAVSEEFVTSFDLGVWGKEAGQAPAMAEDALRGLGWSEMRGRWNG